MSATTSERQAEAAIAYMMDHGDECAKLGEGAWEHAKSKVGATHYGAEPGNGDPAAELKRRLAALPGDVQRVIDHVRNPARVIDLERYGRGGIPADDAARAVAAVQALDIIHDGLGRLAQALSFAQ